MTHSPQPKQYKPLASLSLDLDNLWSYMKTAGVSGWADFPGYLDSTVPRILEFLDRHQLKCTFFIVGQDAALHSNYSALMKIVESGHEIGSHSFNHDVAIARLPYAEVEKEITLAEDAIGEATGEKPLGFRGPSFALSNSILRVLKVRGYRYDASTFPTFIGPLAHYYYFRSTSLSSEEKRQQVHLFGRFSEGFRPLKPYHWHLNGDLLLEIPVSTIPIVRTPFHITYLNYLSGFSSQLALGYFRAALWSCRVGGVEPSLLLHPLDFLGSDDCNNLQAFPGMQQRSHEKLALLSDILNLYHEKFEVLPMNTYADRVMQNRRLGAKQPHFTGTSEAAEKINTI